MKKVIVICSVLILTLMYGSLDEQYNYVENGKASYYANLFEGRLTADGSIFSQDSMTAAHKKLPFGTKVLVSNETNGKTVTVVINDRGPFVKNRIIDLSRRAADSLDMLEIGITDIVIKAFIEDETVLSKLTSELK